MNPDLQTRALRALIAATFHSVATAPAHAGPLHDWDRLVREAIAEARLDDDAARRAKAMVRRSARGAIARLPRGAAHGAAVDAALVTAHFVALASMFPEREAELEAAYHASLARVPESPAKTTGIGAGANAAAAVWAGTDPGANRAAAAPGEQASGAAHRDGPWKTAPCPPRRWQRH